MKQKLLTLLAVAGFVLVVCSFAVIKHSESTVFLTAPDGFSVSCASGYTRAYPHFCSRNVPSLNGINLGGACELLNVNAIWGVPTSARYLSIYLTMHVFGANNVNAQRSINVAFHNLAACGSQFGPNIISSIREDVAVNNTLIYTGAFTLFVPSTATGMPYIANLISGGAGSNVDVTLLGYYD